MNVGGAPGILMVSPRIGTGLDGDKAISPFCVGKCSSCAGKVWIERCRMIVSVMPVASGSIGLPNLNQSVPDRAAIFIQNAAGQDDPFSQRITIMLAGQIIIPFAYRLVPVYGPGNF